MRVVKVEPFSQDSGLLVPFVTQRVLTMARAHPEEGSEAAAKRWLRRLMTCDPAVMALAFVREDGTPVGHVLATLETDDTTWVFVLQADTDEDIHDVRAKGIEMLDTWGASYGATEMRIGTTRSPEAWSRLYGFTTKRFIMSRAIGAPLTKGR